MSLVLFFIGVLGLLVAGGLVAYALQFGGDR